MTRTCHNIVVFLLVLGLTCIPAAAVAQPERGGASNTVGLIVQIVGGVLVLWLMWRVLFGESSDDEQE